MRNWQFILITLVPRSRLVKNLTLASLSFLGLLVVIRTVLWSRASLSHSFLESPTQSIPVSKHNINLVVYNRVPKTGGTSLVHLIYHLCKRNNVGITMVNISWNGVYLNRFNQLQLVHNMSNRRYARPLLLHGHFVFLDFAQLGSTLQPTYLNMIRDPLERLVSHYYFLRFGDDFRPNVIRKRMKHSDRQQTFDDCVVNGGLDCQPKDLWVQVPFFCGHAAYCRIPGNPEALETAKRRVAEDYLLVGLTEEFDEFVTLLEKLLPRFFQGSTGLLQGADGWHLRRTKHKLPINASTRAVFRDSRVWQIEQAFYEFVRAEFWTIRNALIHGPRIDLHQTSVQVNQWIEQQFFFQRTRPENVD
ncbi:heparan sulfate 2-O-sulfotransferase [Opisthorchis viverrini]|uniref:Heparan sulfate 2-O-sulfotransferase n=1 Tax=Opisthorchis viverrini TaxID=6198 RepID=A0A1S8XBC6_OPIVI|nr:heparan sulfate 2-O-sulfotransferase [Opisthorchis viverrini]